jgi:hypothetical protein
VTPRLEGFLGSIQQDPQDLLMRMEGFAVQGLKGMYHITISATMN